MASVNAPVQIEPLTAQEQKQRGAPEHVEDSPEYPEDWKKRAKKITDNINAGYKYYRRIQDGKTYMVLRKGDKDTGLGLWSEEREGKLFTFYPQLQTGGGITRPPPWTPQGDTNKSRGFLAVPISRVAIIPRDYVPSIGVIRYFQIVKEHGFPGDFSKFINDVVTRHFKVCNGIQLPVLIEEEVDVREENERETTA